MNFGRTTSLIISGGAVLYLLAQSTKFLRSKVIIDRSIKSSDDLRCLICDSEKVEDSKSNFVTCKVCGGQVCPKKCSEFLSEYWECFQCRKNRIVQQKTGEWFLKQLTEFSTIHFEMALGQNIQKQIDENGNKILISKVRELIEKCLVKILDGTDLDATPINKICDTDEYLYLFKKHHHVLTSLIFKLEKSIQISFIYDLPNSTINADYVDLKRFINRICHEVINLSDTLDMSDESVPRSSFDPHTYEELLATAVLNKITTDYLQKRKYGMSNQIEADINIVNEEQDFNDLYEREQLNKVQSHKLSLPDLLNEFDDEILSEDQSWEDNWSLKRFESNGNNKISMLIPMPTCEVKTKIGDRDIDEISDSSNKDEISSESFDEVSNDVDQIKFIPLVGKTDDELFKNILHSQDKNNNNDSKQLIDNDIENERLFSEFISSRENIDEIFEEILMNNEDGKKKENVNSLENEKKVENDAEIGNSAASLALNNIESELAPKNGIDLIDKENDASTASKKRPIEESSQKYKSPLFSQFLVPPIQPIKISDTLKNISPNNLNEMSKTNNKLIENNVIEEAKEPIMLKNDIVKLENTEILPKSIPGSIAEREHLKWLKAVPLENNPYSPEVLQKRLSRTQDKHIDIHTEKTINPQNEPLKCEFENDHLREDITKYKRDYYINQESASPLSPLSASSSPITKSMELNQNYSLIESDYSPEQNDSSITVSDDSLTRIYTLSSQETKILMPSENSTMQVSTYIANNEDDRTRIVLTKPVDDVPLPSVKQLAEFYATSNGNSDSNAKLHEPMNIPIGINKITSKRYELSDVPPAKPIASITARTLPPKIKEDLRKSLNPNEESAIIRHNERNVSPDIQRGLAKNSIAYFETFYK